jgi:transposase-like protein
MGQGRTSRKYDKAFKSQAVELSGQPGMTVAKVAADLGIAVNALYRWKKELKEQGFDAFRGQGNRTAAEAELFRLRKENAELKMYVDILKKATAFFAKNPR